MAVRSIKNRETDFEGLLKNKQLEVNSLLEVTQAINNNISSSALFRIYEFILRAQLGIERACVFIKNEDSEVWEAICDYGLEQKYDPIDVKKLLFPITEITLGEKLEDKFIKNFHVVIPVFHKKVPLAYALIGKVERDNPLDEEEIKFIQTITNIISVALENKRLFNQQLKQEGFRREMELAGQMQSLLIPKSLPGNKYFEMSATYKPHSEVGGDYYDVFKLSDDEIAFCIADISGKGIAAALLMSNFQATIRALIYQDFPLTTLVSILNRRIINITGGEKFITFFICIFNSKTKKLKYLNAGHNPPYIMIDDKISGLEEGCTILGMFEQLPDISSGEISIDREAMLLLYTDGLVEQENEANIPFEAGRIMDFVRKNHRKSAEEFKDQLAETLEKYKEDRLYTDDVTILVAKFF
ncbi:MAG: SpoIIE family protein phosphatase [Bacteroidetes bacterium]|nr:SpoIIE family protein phosphatase [Bacteroidota bacterium]